MRTKWIVGSSALALAATGLALTFGASEIAVVLGGESAGSHALSLQLLGAAQIGWAMTNWMSRESMFGGIYGRPLVVGNLLHFFAGGSALFKSSLLGFSPVVTVVAIVYGVLAIAFAWLLFHDPLRGTTV